MSNQPRDDDNAPIPVLGLRPGKGHTVPYTTASANTSPSFDTPTRVVTIFSTSNAFIQTGSSTVTVAASTASLWRGPGATAGGTALAGSYLISRGSELVLKGLP